MNLYSIRNLSLIIYYLELNMVRDRKAHIIYFTQIAAIDRILKEAEITEYLFCITLIELGLQLKEAQDNFQIVN
jgi:hypothetical protein